MFDFQAPPAPGQPSYPHGSHCCVDCEDNNKYGWLQGSFPLSCQTQDEMCVDPKMLLQDVSNGPNLPPGLKTPTVPQYYNLELAQSSTHGPLAWSPIETTGCLGYGDAIGCFQGGLDALSQSFDNSNLPPGLDVLSQSSGNGLVAPTFDIPPCHHSENIVGAGMAVDMANKDWVSGEGPHQASGNTDLPAPSRSDGDERYLTAPPREKRREPPAYSDVERAMIQLREMERSFRSDTRRRMSQVQSSTCIIGLGNSGQKEALPRKDRVVARR
ncbi:hypothetical protein F5Y14DRAFT_465042 [Nemania sp. NC0429]|nr:hypothetical protein F5Y14DRAFT_465042 [Nemania sp. NC0429]